MSDTTIAAADPAPVAATPVRVGFWRGLVTGPGGLPDEAAFAFLFILQPLIVFGAVFNAIQTGHFAFVDVTAAEAAGLALYNVSIGARAKLGNQ